jgi:hypothetical protein
MSFAHYDLLLTAVQQQHDGFHKHGADYRIVRDPSRSRRTAGRPRSLPRGRPDGPPQAA